MSRRTVINQTGIGRIESIPYNDAWIGYICLKCGTQNNVQIGKQLLEPEKAYNDAHWKCKKCNFIHCKESDLPFKSDNWPRAAKKHTGIKAQRFWEAFYRIATENPESYWKQCNTCGRILPFNAFSKHKGFGPLERQMECRCCKGAINAVLNPKRTRQQLHESSVRRRIADLLVEDENENINIEELFERFGGKCFKTGTNLDINDRNSFEIDHILPSKWLYPLTMENACLLCPDANSYKKGKWPSEFYTNNELIELAKITGADLTLISRKIPIINNNIDVNRCVERYLKVREKSHLLKRIKELKKIIFSYNLTESLSMANKNLLGF